MRAPDPNDGFEEYRTLIRMARQFEMLGYDLKDINSEHSEKCYKAAEVYVTLAQESHTATMVKRNKESNDE